MLELKRYVTGMIMIEYTDDKERLDIAIHKLIDPYVKAMELMIDTLEEQNNDETSK